jgi:hypothetical protein
MYAALVPLIVNCYRFILGGNIFIRYAMNILLGISLGATILSLIFVPASDLLPWALFVLIVTSVFMFLKGWKVYAYCKKCRNFSSFPGCAVMKDGGNDESVQIIYVET